jgi:hypothetical protein
MSNSGDLKTDRMQDTPLQIESVERYIRHMQVKVGCYYTHVEMYIWNWLIDWLIMYCFTSHSRIFHLYEDVTVAGEGLQNLGLCSALKPFEQRGIFIVPHLLWHWASVFPVSSEGPPHLVASYDTQGMWRIYSNPDSHKSLFNCFLPHTRECVEPILIPILTDLYIWEVDNGKIWNHPVCHTIELLVFRQHLFVIKTSKYEAEVGDSFKFTWVYGIDIWMELLVVYW